MVICEYGATRIPNRRNTYQFDFGDCCDGILSSTSLILYDLQVPDGSTLVVTGGYRSVLLGSENGSKHYKKLVIETNSNVTISETFQCENIVIRNNNNDIRQSIIPEVNYTSNKKNQFVRSIDAKCCEVILKGGIVRDIKINAKSMVISSTVTFASKCEFNIDSMSCLSKYAWHAQSDAELLLNVKDKCHFTQNTETKFKKLILNAGNADIYGINVEELKINADDVMINCVADIIDGSIKGKQITIKSPSVANDIFSMNKGVVEGDVVQLIAASSYLNIMGDFKIKYKDEINIINQVYTNSGMVKFKPNTTINISSKSETLQAELLKSNVSITGGRFDDPDMLHSLYRFKDTSDVIFEGITSIPPELKYLKCKSITFDPQCCDLSNIEIVADYINVGSNICDNVKLDCGILEISSCRSSKKGDWPHIGNDVDISAYYINTNNREIMSIGDNVTFTCKYSKEMATKQNHRHIVINGPIGDGLKVLPSTDGHMFGKLRIIDTPHLNRAQIHAGELSLVLDHKCITHSLCDSHFTSCEMGVNIKGINDEISYRQAKANIETKMTVNNSIVFNSIYNEIDNIDDVRVGSIYTIDNIKCCIKKIKPKYNMFIVDTYKINTIPNVIVTYSVNMDGSIVFAHGDTYKSSLKSLYYKLSSAEQEAIVAKQVDKYKKQGLDVKYSLSQLKDIFRLVTGACEWGCNNYIATNNLKGEYSINEVLAMENIYYGRTHFIEAFQ